MFDLELSQRQKSWIKILIWGYKIETGRQNIVVVISPEAKQTKNLIK